MATPGLITNHPGMMAAFGAPFIPTEFIGTGGKIFWVGNRSGLPAGDGSKPDYPLSTINAALAKCSSGRGDIVYILPGHAENISAADAWSSLVAGTKIIGLGTGNERPTFTWTAAAGTVLFDVANVLLQNCRLLMAGALDSTTALTVTVGIPVTASGCTLRGCYLNIGVDSDQLTTDAITLSADADQFTLEGNWIEAYAGAVITTVLKTTAGGANDLRVLNNVITAEVATAATGVLLDLDAGALLRTQIIGNHLHNQTANAKYVMDLHASSTGIIDGNRYYVGDGATGPASLGSPVWGLSKIGLNYCVTAVDVSGILCPAADS